VAGIEPAKIDARDLGFRLGPRVNAAGRMGSAMRCVEMFLAEGLQAADLASRLDKENVTRREIEDEVVQAAMQQAEARKGDAGLVVYDEAWHPGVVGIVASRLVEKYHRPVVVIGKGGKGSARSVPGVHVLHAIKAGADALHKYGGHEFAAGVTLREGADADFRAAFSKAVQDMQGGAGYVPELPIDCELPRDLIDIELVRDLERVGPFGTGNPEPLFILREAAVLGRKVVGQNHLKLGLAGGLSAIGFRLASHPDSEASIVDVVFTPMVSEWNGKRKVELQIKALRTARSLSPLYVAP
jgi:single-stranded-DNA-specific exonuclease